MSVAIPVADMCSGTGELSAALRATIRAATALTSLSDADSSSRAYLRDRLAGNAVIARQAALMLTRGLEQLDAIDRKELP